MTEEIVINEQITNALAGMIEAAIENCDLMLGGEIELSDEEILEAMSRAQDNRLPHSPQSLSEYRNLSKNVAAFESVIDLVSSMDEPQREYVKSLAFNMFNTESGE